MARCAFVLLVGLAAGCFADDGRGQLMTAGTQEGTSTNASETGHTSAMDSSGMASGSETQGTTSTPTTSEPTTSDSSTGGTTEATTDDPTNDAGTQTSSTTDSETTTGSTTQSESESDSSSTTGIMCDAPMADCNQMASDGCETDLENSLQHCGDCDTPCEGSCLGGGCKPGKLVFITSKKYAGALGNLNGADAICNEVATDANLPGVYKAWLSTNYQDDPEHRFIHSNEPYLLVDGTLLASDWNDLTDGELDHAISIDETGTLLDSDGVCSSRQVWTNTQPTGYGFVDNRDCDDWTTTQQNTIGRVGLAGATTGLWSDGGCIDYSYCDVPRHLYCFGQ